MDAIRETDGLECRGEAKNDEFLDIMTRYQIFVFPSEYPHGK